MSKIYLVDEGTLDTVLECGNCKERMRYNFAEFGDDREGEDAYGEFVTDIIAAEDEFHECYAEDE